VLTALYMVENMSELPDNLEELRQERSALLQKLGHKRKLGPHEKEALEESTAELGSPHKSPEQSARFQLGRWTSNDALNHSHASSTLGELMTVADYEHALREEKRKLEAEKRGRAALQRAHHALKEEYDNAIRALEESRSEGRSVASRLTEEVEKLLDRNMELAVELAAVKEEKDAQWQRNNSLEESTTVLRELVLRGYEGQQRMDKRAWAEKNKMEQLATAEVLAASQPPADFPIPHLPTGGRPTSGMMSGEVEGLRAQLFKEREESRLLQSKCRALQSKHDTLSASHLSLAKHSKHTLTSMQKQLMGCLRRIRWLLDQQADLKDELETKDAYIGRLESTLLKREKDSALRGVTSTNHHHHRSRSQLNGSSSGGADRQNNKTAASPGAFSYWQGLPKTPHGTRRARSADPRRPGVEREQQQQVMSPARIDAQILEERIDRSSHSMSELLREGLNVSQSQTQPQTQMQRHAHTPSTISSSSQRSRRLTAAETAPSGKDVGSIRRRSSRTPSSPAGGSSTRTVVEHEFSVSEIEGFSRQLSQLASQLEHVT
jgi:hypothetical protein